MLIIMKVYDGNNQILGRMSTHVAKDLLKGEQVRIINCEKMRISGNPVATKKKYLERRQRGDRDHGPFFPKTPHKIVRRTVRGMLPKYRKGQRALRRLKVHVGTPKELSKIEPISLKESDANRLKCKSISVEELSLWLGTPKRW
ncbi:MAG: 50S ribosomal protein L13 [Candidatus Aenigmarchaeota archaeon]|nr:50S ribosomal protein L13 [Candidatus Aenigmarchaeota archaeon]